MHSVGLIISFLLLLPIGLTAPNGIDALGCYDNTVVSPGFIGHVDTYTGGNGPTDERKSEYSKFCGGLVEEGDYKTGSSFIGNMEPTTSINLNLTNPKSIYGVAIKDEVSATLTGWWYAPLDGMYTFTLSALNGARIDIEGTSCCGTVVTGFYMHACTPMGTVPRTLTHTREFRGGVYYPIAVVYVRALGDVSLSVPVTLPDGSTVEDIGSMVYQVEQVEQNCPITPASSSEVSTTPTTTASSSLSSSVSHTSTESSSSPSSMTTLTVHSSSTLTEVTTLTAYSNSTLTTVTTATAENGSTTVLTLTSTLTYCPECENSANETVSIPTTTATETKVITSTNDEGQTVILTTTITTTYCPEYDSLTAGQTTSVVPTFSALSSGSIDTSIHTKEVALLICTTCAGSVKEPEVESGPVSASTRGSAPGIVASSISEPAFKSGVEIDTASGDYFSTVTQIVFSTISKSANSSSSGYTFSSIWSSSVPTTAAVSTYDGSGSAMGMVLTLAILPLLALLV